jgi:hypothetical protein
MNIKRWLTLTPKSLDLGITPGRTVAMRFHFKGDEIGLAPGIGVAIQMTPAEARRIAQVLARKADQAEAGPSQP